jgi:hypothetical protein
VLKIEKICGREISRVQLAVTKGIEAEANHVDTLEITVESLGRAGAMLRRKSSSSRKFLSDVEDAIREPQKCSSVEMPVRNRELSSLRSSAVFSSISKIRPMLRFVPYGFFPSSLTDFFHST